MIYTVRYYDIEDYNFYNDREEWARKNCKSFIQMKGTDFSDVSFSKYVVVYDFTFFDEKDAIMFKLMWS